ncbi:MAG: hypothetical protein GX549_06180 [Clostridiales bacterium]|nr:hypothetical protein [Clostridiales bacterium]
MGILVDAGRILAGTGEAGFQLTSDAGQATVARVAGRDVMARAGAAQCCADGWHIAYEGGGFDVLDRIEPVCETVARLTRSWTRRSAQPFTGQLCVHLETAFEPSFYLIPAVSYDGNAMGKGKEPKGLSHEGADWIYSYERTSLPAATFTERPGLCAGLFASPDDRRSLVCSCGLRAAGSRMIHRILYPEVEEPLCYWDTDTYREGFADTIAMEPGESFEVSCYIYLRAGAPFRFGWFDAFSFFFDNLTVPFANRFSTDELWDMGIGYLHDQLWVDNGLFTGFSIGLLPGGEHRKGAPGMKWMQRIGRQYEIGWAGQNYSNALILMQDHITNGNRKSLDDAIRILDLWEQNARVPNGLFYVIYDCILEGRHDAVVDTCNLGWGALQAMTAWETAQSLGIDKPAWRDMGLKCCDFFVDAFERMGTFGKTWRLREGTCIDDSGTVGAFMLMPMTKAYRLTGDPKYLRVATDALAMYVRRDLDNMACNAGALDTNCVDCETSYALLEAANRLYEITGERRFLDIAVRTAQFAASWIFLFDVVAEEGSDFDIMRYRTTGAGAVSTQHHHLHYATLYFIREWILLSRYTGDDRWLRYARLCWSAAQQLISDGTLTLHGMTRPRGSENEAYLQCRWCIADNGGRRHYLSDWLVIWPVTFRLLALTGPDRERIAAILDGREQGA